MPTLAFTRKYITFHIHFPELAARCGPRPLSCCVWNLCNSREQVVLKITMRRRQRARSARTHFTSTYKSDEAAGRHRLTPFSPGTFKRLPRTDRVGLLRSPGHLSEFPWWTCPELSLSVWKDSVAATFQNSRHVPGTPRCHTPHDPHARRPHVRNAARWPARNPPHVHMHMLCRNLGANNTVLPIRVRWEMVLGFG
jgi:hypothetical protein